MANNGIGVQRLAVVRGDGIGPEVVDAALLALDILVDQHEMRIERCDVDLGTQRYLSTGQLWPDDARSALAECDAIFFGALGDPRVAPGLLERGVILAMRREFDLAVNVRPVRLYPGIESPVRSVTSDNCDLVIVRENSEGAYIDEGMTAHAGKNRVATQVSVNTYRAIERAVDFSFRLAAERSGGLTLCHKTNILVAAGGLWADVVRDVGQRYSQVEVDYVHVDAFCALLPSQPERFDIVVTDNLFGDIITDLGAFVQGGMGTAASANLNLTGTSPSMFEPVHGSAPDIAGSGRANPAAAMLSLALCLASLGYEMPAARLELAVATALAAGVAKARHTHEVTDAVCAALRSDAPSPGDGASGYEVAPAESVTGAIAKVLAALRR